MAERTYKRKLAAIFSADVAGYSRLMGEDEAATVRTLETYKGVMSTLIQQYRGRVVDSPGDNLLAEFSSVVDAIQCAVAVQKELEACNAELPESRRMQFRIGINLGDVIEEGERLFGDGVNVAARLEGLAEPGGLCISGPAYDQVKNKLPFVYVFQGEQSVKNIPEPVRVYRIKTETEAPARKKIKARGTRSRGLAVGFAALLVILVGAAVVWYFQLRPVGPTVEAARMEKMAYPLPDKPSIAVLPFANMSEDKEQEYFSDGMTEDLITDLSKISGLFVIARNSTFTYKGKPVKIRQVAEELGVRYVLEGSVRRAGEQVRINAQLIDASTGHHLWAERYDGSMKEVFALQDKINQKIVAALAIKLTPQEKERISDKGTQSPEAYAEFVKGREYERRRTPQNYSLSMVSLKRALEIDPQYGEARSMLGMLYWHASQVGLWGALNISWPEARLLARQCLKEAMKKPNAWGHGLAGYMAIMRRQHSEAISHLEKALAMLPNDPQLHGLMGYVLNYAGRPKDGIEHEKRALRLDPENPTYTVYQGNIGIAHFIMGQWQETVTVMEKLLRANPEATFLSGWIAASYAHLGREDEARAAYGAFARRVGRPSLPVVMYTNPFRDRHVADSFAEGLVKAGMTGRVSDVIHVSPEDQLTGETLNAFVYPSVIEGFTLDGSQLSMQFARDGTVTVRSPGVPGGEDTGRSWIEGDTVCFQFRSHMFGMEYCGATFKNQRGTPERKDEYVRFMDTGMTAFSRLR
jgi:adenylate cyclase